ncbi:MAG: XdhC family protein, partial [Desulfovibrionaceae bacterium]
MSDFVRSVRAALEGGQSLVLATVAASAGSAPRSAGAKMAVRPDGSIFGTVGGGVVEAQAIRRAAALHARGPGAAERLDMNLTSDLA